MGSLDYGIGHQSCRPAMWTYLPFTQSSGTLRAVVGTRFCWEVWIGELHKEATESGLNQN